MHINEDGDAPGGNPVLRAPGEDEVGWTKVACTGRCPRKVPSARVTKRWYESEGDGLLVEEHGGQLVSKTPRAGTRQMEVS